MNRNRAQLDQQSFRPSIPIILTWLALYITISIVGILFLFVDEFSGPQKSLIGAPIAVLGTVSTVAWIGVHIKRTPVLTIDHTGIIFANNIRIAWQEIATVRVATRGYLEHLEVWAHNPQEIRERAPRLQSRLDPLVRQHHLPILIISNIRLHPYSPEEVVQEMLKYNPQLRVAR